MSDQLPESITASLDRKRAWHRAQASLPLKEKVRILLELQRQDLPLLARRRPLRRWERPWNIEPRRWRRRDTTAHASPDDDAVHPKSVRGVLHGASGL
jgi:hypothetical protein